LPRRRGLADFFAATFRTPRVFVDFAGALLVFAGVFFAGARCDFAGDLRLFAGAFFAGARLDFAGVRFAGAAFVFAAEALLDALRD
jgi:hypothetical protein